MLKLTGDEAYCLISLPKKKNICNRGQKLCKSHSKVFCSCSILLYLFTLSKYVVQDCRVEQREDTLPVVIPFFNDKKVKIRNISIDLGSVYDTTGLISSVHLIGKILHTEICELKIPTY